MSDVFDLDKRAAELGHGPRQIKFAGQLWDVPRKFPFRAQQVIGKMAPLQERANAEDPEAIAECVALLDEFWRCLFGDQTDAILAAGFDEDALDILMSGLYGVTLGESVASVSSLPNSGDRSRPTSVASTA